MVQPISIPAFPPEEVWGTYIWLLLIPFTLRVLLLTGPFTRVTKQLSPHSGWILKRFRELPIKGFGMLAFNEILAFFIPMLVVFIFRMTRDPLGWDDWASSNSTGLAVLMIITMGWIVFDLFRIARVRRMLSAVEKQNIERLKLMADAGMGVRGLLRKFAGKDDPEPETDTKKKIAKSALTTWGLLALKARKFTPAGLVSAVATSAAIELARKGASKISDKIDEHLQHEFEKIAEANTKTLILFFLRDLAMGLFPLFAIWIVSDAFP